MRGSTISENLVGIARAYRRNLMPERVHLLSQVIRIEEVENLHVPAQGEWVHADGEGEPSPRDHAHRAYGVYEEAPQVITLDNALAFERKRDTFLHENLHAMLAIVQLDALIEGQAEGMGEHLVGTLAPVLLAWLRDNPEAVAWLQEVQ